MKTRLRKWGVIVIAVLILLNIFSFLVLPRLAKRFLCGKLTEQLKRTVTLDRIRVNPYTLVIEAYGVFVHEPQSSEVFIYCRKISVDLSHLSVFRLAPGLQQLEIDTPYVNLVRKKENIYNFSDLLTRKGPKGKPFRFLVCRAKIDNGRIFFDDRPRNTRHVVRSIDLGLPFISNRPSHIDRYTAPFFSAVVNGTPFVLQGKTKPFADSLETYFDISIKKLNLPGYLAYMPVPLNFKLTSGYLSGDVRASYIQHKRAASSLLLKGNLQVTETAVDDLKGKRLVRIPEIATVINAIDVFKRTLELGSLTVQAPEISVRREPDGRLNLLALLPENPQTAAPETESPGAAPFLFKIVGAGVVDGKVDFQDASLKVPFGTVLKDLTIDVTSLSNEKDRPGQVAFSTRTESGEVLSLNSSLGLNPLLSAGRLNLERIILKKYAPYYADALFCEVGDGQAALAGEYAWVPDKKTPTLSLSRLLLSVTGLKLNRKGGETFLSVPVATVSETEADITNRKVTVGRVTTGKGSLTGARLKGGALDFLPAAPASAEKTPVAAQPGKKWSVLVKALQIDDYSLRLRDLAGVEPVNITADRFSVKASNLVPGTGARSPVACSFLLNGKGDISASGYYIEKPFSTVLQLAATDLPIMSMQAYFTEQINITITDGRLSSRGTLVLELPGNTKPKITYTGEATLSDFKSIDRVYGEAFASLDSLSLRGMTIGRNPDRTAVEEVDVRGFFANVLVHQDKRVNLMMVMKEGPKPAGPKAAPPVTAPPVDQANQTYIGKIILQNGRVKFVDRSVKPDYALNLTDLEASVTGLSSMASAPAQMHIKARLENSSTLALDGRMQPFGKDFFLDMKVALSALDLTPASPYSAKYVGYTTQKGKLTLDLAYLINKRKLESQNKILLDQLTLGDKVDSPDAIKAPVKFAIVLLRDTAGRIELNLPVSGSLDDPKFRVGPIIVQLLVNLLAKAATAPFKLLGAMFGGGGEELSYVEFDYGTAVIPAEGARKLDTLVKILKDRPGLNLEIEGHVDAAADAEALRKILFARKVKARKLKELAKREEKPVSVDDVVLDPKEYEHYLWLAYKNEKFPRQRNLVGFVKELPVPEMEKLMLEHTEVTDDDLRLLAVDRGARTKEYLLKAGTAEDRIFLLQPKSGPPPKTETGAKSSRVDFHLKPA